MIHRTPNGFPFMLRGTPLIQVNRTYSETYDHLLEGGLYRALSEAGRIRRFRESGLKYARSDAAYRVLKLEETATIPTYAPEWGFSAWKAGALCVLDVMEIALEYGMVLRYTGTGGMTFDRLSPLWGDPLAFELYEDGRRWSGYRQYVRAWLAPLALMTHVDPRLGVMARAYPDGVPPQMASALLPVRTRVNFGLTAHIHLAGRDILAGRADRAAIKDTLDTLRETVEGLRWTPELPEKRSGYTPTDYDQEMNDYRQTLVRGYLGKLLPLVVWDMAAANGDFARLASEIAGTVMAFDDDPANVDLLWREAAAAETPKIIPLLMDWTNPTPNGGWAFREQPSIGVRANPDVLLVLGWVHRLSLVNGVSFTDMAVYFARLAEHLIIEFIPHTDPHVIALMPTGAAPPEHYTTAAFEAAFREHFEIVYIDDVKHTDRVLYQLRRKASDG